jgi:alcohol dehydrogenase, propanol-preferring
VKAARLHEFGGDLVIEDIPIPEPGTGEVLVRIGGAGACHSDLHVKSGEIPGLPTPLLMGHENAGWVEAFGPGAQGFEIGAPVVVFGGWGCGRCRFCLGGQEQLCDTSRWGGLGPDGGYAEYMVVPNTRHLLPAGGLDPARAAPLTDAALTPYSAVKKTLPRLVPGSTAVMIGAGGLGQYGVQFLKLLSPTNVIVVDTSPGKRARASQLGADHVVDPGDENVLEEILELTGGEGANVAIDFVGIDATIALGASSLGRQGLFMLVGLAGGNVPFSYFNLPTETTMTSSKWGTRNELEEVLAFARSGRLTSTIEQRPLGDINDVFARMAAGQIAGRAVLIP